MKTKSFIRGFFLLVLLLVLVARQTALALQTAIGFDDVASGTLVNTQYAGVTFTNPIGGNVFAKANAGFWPAATNVVFITNGGNTFPFFDAVFGAIDASFATPKRTVSIDVRPVSQLADHLDPTTRRPFFQAFDGSGNLLATVYYAGTLPNGCCYEVGAMETLSYTSPSGNIARVRFSSQVPTNSVHTYGLFDNLRFDDGYYSLNISIVGGGTVLISPLGPYYYGATPSLTPSPLAGWSFKDWTGDFTTTQAQLLLNPMTANVSLTATFIPTPQTGPNFVVTTNDDHDDGDPGVVDCTLREAINAANANADASTITFASNVTGVIMLTLGELTINHDLTILAPGVKVLSVNINNTSGFARISGGAKATFSGLSVNNFLVGFSASTGLSIDGGCALSLDACKISGFKDKGILNGGTFAMNNSTVSGNSSDYGGGLRNYGTAGITNSTFSGNSGVAGGAIHNQGTLTLINSTISQNIIFSSVGGGGINNAIGAVTVGNSLIAGNTNANAANGPDCAGSFTSLGYNLIGKTNDSTGFSGANQDQVGSSALPLNPKLGPLADNGGATPTHTPLTGSPAIDQGKSFSLATDQRGRTRPYDFPSVASAAGGDGSDIGAIEVNPPVLNIAKSAGNVVLSWSTNHIGFTLQSTAQLIPAVTWTTVPIDPLIVAGQYTVTSTATGAQFYRLMGSGVATIPGLFNTGVGPTGVILASGAVDPHWQIIQSPDVSFPGPNAIVLNDSGFPISPWLANGPLSKWIAPQADESVGNALGNYTYRIFFDLTGLEPSTAVITGHWTSDNLGADVRLNFAATGFTGDGNFGALNNPFTISNGFIGGVNTLDFIVNNAGTGANPTGLRVELSGTANFQPLP